MQISESLRDYIQGKIEDIKNGAPGSLSGDQSALMVDGSIGYSCFVSLAGDVFIEEYGYDDVTQQDEFKRSDRSRRAQISALVLGSRNHPVLSELLPPPVQRTLLHVRSAPVAVLSESNFVTSRRSPFYSANAAGD
jgi:hypothetical protein